MDAGKDFFISYTSADKKWAEWIAWQLEEVQYSTILQAWDFQPGMNFVLEMEKAARAARCTIVVLSHGYLNAPYTQPEWAVAFRRDPKSEKGTLLPVRVQKCEVEGLLGPIVYIDLVDLDEARAHETLLVGVRRERGKPDTAPGFPGVGQHTQPEPQRFPGALPPLWNVPYPRNPYFTGRQNILNKLYDALRSGKTTALTQPQAISGLGGIGKTQCAVEYAYRYHNDYQAVLWARAETYQLLILDFVAIAGLLNLPEKEMQDQNLAVEAVKGWLKERRDWLLILDNADDLPIVSAFVPPVFGGHLLLTTRARATGRMAQRIEVEKMEPEEGALFLLHRATILDPEAPLDDATRSDRDTAKEIVQVMDGLPLALEQAGAYIEETECGLQGYLRLYRAQGVRLLKEYGEFAPDHPKPVATTWSLSFEKVEQANAAAAELLRFCAFLAPDAIPEELFAESAAELGPTLEPVASDPSNFNVALRDLLKYSLVDRDPETNTLSIHRLVQEVLKDQMEEETQRLWAERVLRAVNAAFPHAEFSTWPQCERVLPQALTAVQIIEQYQVIIEEAGRLLAETASYLEDRARYAEAEPLFQSSLAIYEQQWGPEHPDVATSLNELANLYRKQGKYVEAEPLYQRALRIREQQLGPEHPDVADSLNGLAIIYREQGKYEQAESLFQRALRIGERAYGPEHPDVATPLNGLAIIYREQGKYEQAESLFQRALRIREQQLGPEHPSVANVLINLANFYQEQGRYVEAEPLYQRALHINEQQWGPEHPNVATSLNGLANLYSEQGKYGEAEPLYQRALRIWEQQLGPEHPDVANVLTNLANFYQKQGKYVEAEPLYQRALHINEQALRPDHPFTVTTLKNYASLLQKMQRTREAAVLEQRASVIQVKSS